MKKHKKNKVEEPYVSRKWKLVLLTVMLATLGAFVPPVVNIWLLNPFVILTGTEWVSIITLVVGAYFGINVWQKHIEKQRFIVPEDSGVEGPKDEEEDDSDKEA